MSVVAIPGWNSQGLLPPVDVNSQPMSEARSPYPVSLKDVVTRFATSQERNRILDGLLSYRAALHALGLVEGFQWLDGSFTEDVETLQQRAPNDIDVVSFVRTPKGFCPDPAAIRALSSPASKASFKVDAFFVEMNLPPDQLAAWSVYWYSLWAHRRNHVWKGFLQVDLAPVEDAAALACLNQNCSTGVGP